VIHAWISSRYEYWDQSSFSFTHIKTYMDQHQYGQANSRFLKSSSFWLDTPNTHINLYIHTSSLIILMQSDFLNLYPYKQTKVETITVKIRTSDRRPELLTFAGFNLEQCPLSFDLCLVCPHLCTLDSFSNPWWRLVHCPTLLIHAKQATIETNSKSSTHVLFFIWQISFLSHDAMISHHRSHFIDSICIVVFCLN
jgi:hypothetical protein